MLDNLEADFELIACRLLELQCEPTEVAVKVPATGILTTRVLQVCILRAVHLGPHEARVELVDPQPELRCRAADCRVAVALL